VSRRSVWKRALGRARREVEARRHTVLDERLLRRARAGVLLTGEERRLVGQRLASQGPEPLVLPESPVEGARQAIDTERAMGDAAGALRGTIRLFGHDYDLLDPTAWHRDPLRDAPWPRRGHAQIRLDDPKRPGDVRMQWEAARFHHALCLARVHVASGGPDALKAFLAHVDAFERGCPAFRTIHWAVGMEVAIRAASWSFALEFFRGAPGLTPEWRERLVRLLFLHGLFLEHHIERHPLGFTTNHTLADHAGLCILGRMFRETAAGERWRSMGVAGLRACLTEQVLPGGAHAEGSLPYERFCLESGLAAFAVLNSEEREDLETPLRALALHLSAARLGSGMPFVGDGDDSFFPPFGYRPFDARDPLDPEAVLQAAETLLDIPGLRARPETEEAALWLGAPARGEARELLPATRLAQGFIRFESPPLSGLMIVRGRGGGWLPTHAHNDLLSIVLDLDGVPLLIDPGTGGYGCDRALRQRLRSTAAHSTLQVGEREQSPIDLLKTFEGPEGAPCGAQLLRADPPDIVGWHEGFGEDLIHTRRVHVRIGLLCIEDILAIRRPRRDAGAIESILRFRLAPGVGARLEADRGRVTCLVEVPSGRARFILLRPTSASWQIGAEPTSRRYGSHESAPVLEARQIHPLPHRWLTVVHGESLRNR
jgi:hypothetical protein